MPKKTKIPNGLSFYKSKCQFYWRICKSGRIVGASSEGYTRIGAARKNLVSVLGTKISLHDIYEAIAAAKKK